jgi:hypothetical protein
MLILLALALRRRSPLVVLGVPLGLALTLAAPALYLPMALNMLLVLTLVAAVLSGVARHPSMGPRVLSALGLGPPPFPAALPLLGFVLQYLAGYTVAGSVYSYLGAFLSLPVSLALLGWVSRFEGRPVRRAGWWAPAALGLTLALGASQLLYLAPYREGPRSELTASFQSGELRGIRSEPDYRDRIDGVVRVIDQHSAPGDPILVFPDLPMLYQVADRRNPTRQDWYLPWGITVDDAQRAARDLERDPPKVVILQTYREEDVHERARRPIDYLDEPKLAPIYQFIQARYVRAGAAQDLTVYLPGTPTRI